MKKFLTIALLVMALCVVSVAVSAEVSTSVAQDGVVTVTATAPTTAGQTVVLAVQGNTTNIETVAAWSDLASKIIYVDQATATNSAEFKFIPREYTTGEGESAVTAPYQGDAVVFSSYDGATAVAYEAFSTIPVVEYTLTFDANGGTASAATMTVKSNETSKALPTATKVGYKFEGWVAEGTTEAVTTVDGSALNAGVAYTAKWTAYFADANNNVNDSTHTNTGLVGEASEVADAGSYINEDGDKEYAVSVTATVAEVDATIAGFGFYIYNVDDETKAPVIKKEAGTLAKNDKFYAIAEGIPEGQEEASVYFKPFVYDAAGNTYWGAGKAYKVKDFAALKNLGTKAN